MRGSAAAICIEEARHHPHPPSLTRRAPSPVACRLLPTCARFMSKSPTGDFDGEKGRAFSLPLHFPCRGPVFVVLERDAHRGELVTDAVGFFPVFCGAGGEAPADFCINLVFAYS